MPDEGKVRVKVQWFRADGRKLPKKAREHKGRLEIRNIGVHEGGLYICKATHYENEKGGQAIANVEILRN